MRRKHIKEGERGKKIGFGRSNVAKLPLAPDVVSGEEGQYICVVLYDVLMFDIILSQPQDVKHSETTYLARCQADNGRLWR